MALLFLPTWLFLTYLPKKISLREETDQGVWESEGLLTGLKPHHRGGSPKSDESDYENDLTSERKVLGKVQITRTVFEFNAAIAQIILNQL